MQVCKKCDIKKTTGDFYKDTKNKLKVSKVCKSCESKISKKYYENNRRKILKKRSEYRKNNKDKINEYQEVYSKENPEVGMKAKKKWLSKPANKKATLIASKKWCEKNKGKRRNMSARRRASKLRATPRWADMEKIAGVYIGAKKLEDLMGIKFHVDHIIPLQGDNVCGLHIWENLQVLEQSLNLKKGNKL